MSTPLGVLAAALLTTALIPWSPGSAGVSTGALPFTPTTPAPRVPVVVHRTGFVMGTTLELEVVAASRVGAMAAAEAALREAERMERLLSTWTGDSELSRLNALPAGKPWTGNREVMALLTQVLEWAEATGGAFHPGVGPLIDAWDLRGTGRRPEADELAESLHRSGAGAFSGSTDLMKIRDGAWMDAGGFGKGAALRAAGRVLRQAGVASATLNLGGQLLVLPPAETSSRPVQRVAVAHPGQRETALTHLVLRPGTVPSEGLSVSTSGLSERWIEVDGERFGHVLDPRTGFPVPAWGSVTVVAADPVVADLLSTALLVMGPEEGLMFAETLPQVGALFLSLQDDEVSPAWSRGMAPYLEGHLTAQPTSSHR